MRTLFLAVAWLSVTGALGVVLGSSLGGDRERAFLPGRSSDGHFQIEDQCSLCHTPFAGVKQDACLGCHRDELDHLDDSHPPAKFLDPRSFELVGALDARQCITCHREHSPERTADGGSTQPPGFCDSCHADIGAERASHRGVSFASCQDAGCHNFHDNRALSQDFLEQHRGEPALLPGVAVEVGHARSHELAGVGCEGCHEVDGAWQDRPGDGPCAACHEDQASTFALGRHGMRAAAGAAPMSPSLARLPMRPEASHRKLGCTSCHGAHEFDTGHAAVEACLGCHADDHSLAYQKSPHYALWVAELAGIGPPGSGVSCATCHLPRRGGVPTHNQSEMMRPPEKMLRPVCQQCHGVEFSLDALVDPDLVERNFVGTPRPRPSLERAP